jgi:predicted Fe-Mo cluster-binding NifX family protein
VSARRAQPPETRAGRGECFSAKKGDEADMKICIPIVENRGLLSPVSPHFATAPMFLLVDTLTLAFRSIPNLGPAEGCRCDPYRVLGDQPVDSFIVGGIGTNALTEIARRNVPVYRTVRGRVADALAGFIAGKLPTVREGTRGPGWAVS